MSHLPGGGLTLYPQIREGNTSARRSNRTQFLSKDTRRLQRTLPRGPLNADARRGVNPVRIGSR